MIFAPATSALQLNLIIDGGAVFPDFLNVNDQADAKTLNRTQFLGSAIVGHKIIAIITTVTNCSFGDYSRCTSLCAFNIGADSASLYPRRSLD